MRGRLVPIGATLVVVAVAMARAATSPAPSMPPLDRKASGEAFMRMATQEEPTRKQALHDWPADPWSEDDHFHHLEHQRAQQVASQLRTTEQDVLRIVDDGMRERWLLLPLRTTVPPCRPRPITD